MDEINPVVVGFEGGICEVTVMGECGCRAAEGQVDCEGVEMAWAGGG